MLGGCCWETELDRYSHYPILARPNTFDKHVHIRSDELIFTIKLSSPSFKIAVVKLLYQLQAYIQSALFLLLQL